MPKLPVNQSAIETEKEYRTKKQKLIDEYFEKINAAGNGAITEIGRLLKEYKDKAGHGDFLPLLERLGIDERRAQEYMSVHKVFGSNTRKLRAFSSLPQRAIFMLSSPSTPKQLRDEILEVINEGEKLTIKDIKELIDEAKEAEKPKPAAKPLPKPTKIKQSGTSFISQAEYEKKLTDEPEDKPEPVYQTEVESVEDKPVSNIIKFDAKVSPIPPTSGGWNVIKPLADTEPQKAGRPEMAEEPFDWDAHPQTKALKKQVQVLEAKIEALETSMLRFNDIRDYLVMIGQWDALKDDVDAWAEQGKPDESLRAEL